MNRSPNPKDNHRLRPRVKGKMQIAKTKKQKRSKAFLGI